ncbi:glycosyltransferase family 2 protein [Termitidicoccus mucosus]|uniref:Glycosyltransferase 2-like domain-containing protein n=1 Tax=Termitidicoccus mucosus TaxID=1184151 RepID=A0A178IDR6_9BACT|nr:hypothetical protein AW736_20285 [Opitutaceae bacterium TSB47]
MNLADITPLILTWNEEPNLRRCLERLRWATRIVVVDSGSTDGTLAIAAEFPQVEVVKRGFDSFAGQCNFGLEQIRTKWVLSMDADYIVANFFSTYVEKLSEKADGYCFPFRYCVYGSPLRATLYPRRTVLYQHKKARYRDDGHGHRVDVQGAISNAEIPIDHDDRKSLSRWLDSQRKYAALEAEKLLSEPRPSGWPDRLRKKIWPAAPAMFFYTLFVKRLILDGWPGLYYVFQRTYAELLLSLELISRKFVSDINRAEMKRG